MGGFGFPGSCAKSAALDPLLHRHVGDQFLLVAAARLAGGKVEIVTGLRKYAGERVENRLIRRVLLRCGGNVAEKAFGVGELKAAVGEKAAFAPPVAIVVDAGDEVGIVGIENSTFRTR